MMKKRTFLIILAAFLALAVLCLALYLFPPINERLSWRLANLRTQIFYRLHPPDQVVLAPDLQIDQIVQATMNAYGTLMAPSVTPLSTQVTPLTPTTSPTLSPTATPIPAKVYLSGVPHEYQSFNNCGPANLSQVLRYWGWEGDQRNTRDFLRSNEDDSNVMPEEMAAFVESETELKALIRFGGSLEIIKSFLAAGFPLILETGHDPDNDWWMGHYVTINAYDDEQSIFFAQDSLIMADLPIPYDDIGSKLWRDFNRVYLVIYPPNREAEVLSILGNNSDPNVNLENTVELTKNEIPSLAGRDLFFALYNQGAAYFRLGQIPDAVAFFDQAFSLYQTLDEEQRPWRVLWYREEAYQTYFQAGRYQAVIDLTNAALSMLSKHGLEESHYWRGMAYEALGDYEKAKNDYQIALELRPSYQLAQLALARLN
jgi:tetratricopeptide (TPR) repeat protein